MRKKTQLILAVLIVVGALVLILLVKNAENVLFSARYQEPAPPGGDIWMVPSSQTCTTDADCAPGYSYCSDKTSCFSSSAVCISSRCYYTFTENSCTCSKACGASCSADSDCPATLWDKLMGLKTCDNVILPGRSWPQCYCVRG